MRQYAVDVVILPPDEIISKAIELNRMIIRSNPPKIKLNKENCIPHISLSMGVLKDNDREVFVHELKTLTGNYKPLSLECSGIYAVEIPTGEKISGIAIENSNELYALHKDVMELSGRYMTDDATGDMVYSPPPVEDITVQIIKDYPQQSAFENFRPHITLGVGEMFDPEFTTVFTASELALFRLGNYCTCRIKLAEILL